MNKLEAYQSLYRMMRKFKALKLSERVELRGNLAYFVDRYCDTDGWQVKLDELLDYIGNKDMNGACLFLSNEICDAFEVQYAESENLADVREAQLNNVIDQSVHSNGCLDDFEVISPAYYPEFFLDYERRRAANPV